LEGRLTEDQLLNFRQEVDGNGLSSYPHPKLMPEFWQFPTVSMGLGPLMAIPSPLFEIPARPWHCQHRKPQGLGVLR
jgi:pyruvate dehydrogenase complex dehydrogenase (E1) component